MRRLTDRIRIYGATRWGGVAAEEASRLGFREILLGIWLGRDRPANKREVGAAVALARRHLRGLRLIVVGNEVVLRGDLTVAELAATMRKVEAATGLAVAYADTAATWLRPQIEPVAEEASVLLAHIYPYWDGIPIDRAPSEFARTLAALRARYPTKPIWVGETGWPARGGAVGAAVASPENQARWLSFVLRRSRRDRIFFFEAFDEPWKALHEGERGAAWGIWGADGRLHPSLAPTLRAAGIDPAQLEFDRTHGHDPPP